MKYVINVLLFVLICVTLLTVGVDVRTWQYWVIMACVAGVSINALLW